MTVLDAPLRNVAEQLLNQFGRPVTLHLVDLGDYDTNSGQAPALGEQDVTVRALDGDWRSRPARPGEGGRNSSQGRDSVLTIAAKGLPRDPTTRDEVIDGENTLQIQDVNPIYSGDLVALFELHVRR